MLELPEGLERHEVTDGGGVQIWYSCPRKLGDSLPVLIPVRFKDPHAAREHLFSKLAFVVPVEGELLMAFYAPYGDGYLATADYRYELDGSRIREPETVAEPVDA